LRTLVVSSLIVSSNRGIYDGVLLFTGTGSDTAAVPGFYPSTTTFCSSTGSTGGGGISFSGTKGSFGVRIEKYLVVF
jgi:hypothetical protein